MPGRLIAIEGIDGAGKGTQARRLVDSLQREGRRVAHFSFPRYAETRHGELIADYLNGRFGPLENVDPMLAALLFAGDRFESRSLLFDAIENHEFVVCDRYIASNMAYQGARKRGENRRQLLERVAAIEYEVHGLPRADATILLDLGVTTAKSLVARKARRDYTDAAEDLHESDKILMTEVRAVYEVLAREPGWKVIRCEEAGGIRGIDAIAADIRAAIDAI